MSCYNTGCQSYQKWYIGNDIRNLLLADEEVAAQVGNHIYPIVAAEGTDGDFIVYSRQKYAKSYTKMGVYQDECQVAVVAISDNYDNAIALASKIDNALTGQQVVGDGIRIKLDLVDSMETFDDNKFIETLLFEIK